jgi:hypothetical protein
MRVGGSEVAGHAPPGWRAGSERSVRCDGDQVQLGAVAGGGGHGLKARWATRPDEPAKVASPKCSRCDRVGWPRPGWQAMRLLAMLGGTDPKFGAAASSGPARLHRPGSWGQRHRGHTAVLAFPRRRHALPAGPGGRARLEWRCPGGKRPYCCAPGDLITSPPLWDRNQVEVRRVVAGAVLLISDFLSRIRASRSCRAAARAVRLAAISGDGPWLSRSQHLHRAAAAAPTTFDRRRDLAVQAATHPGRPTRSASTAGSRQP